MGKGGSGRGGGGEKEGGEGGRRAHNGVAMAAAATSVYLETLRSETKIVIART